MIGRICHVFLSFFLCSRNYNRIRITKRKRSEKLFSFIFVLYTFKSLSEIKRKLNNLSDFFLIVQNFRFFAKINKNYVILFRVVFVVALFLSNSECPIFSFLKLKLQTQTKNSKLYKRKKRDSFVVRIGREEKV